MINWTEANIIASTYYDTMDIYRNVKYVDAFGITQRDYQLLYGGISCALSKSNNQVVNEKDTGNLNYEHELFTFPDTDILEGDKIYITRYGVTDIYQASKPFYYPSHIEVYLNFEERV